SSESSIAGSRATSTAAGASAATSATSPSPGSTDATSCAPASASADSRRSRAAPARASSSTRTAAPCSVIVLRLQQVVDVAQQLVLLVRLAEIAFDADLEGALAMLLAGTRGDHDDRHVAQAR